jgi:CRP-like cAMP-binding protein
MLKKSKKVNIGLKKIGGGSGVVDVKFEKIIFDIVPKLSFFGGASKEDISSIMEYINEVTAEAGEYIYKEGDSPTNLYILLEGDIEFFMFDEKIADGELGILFGTSATIGIQKQMASARAKTNVKLAVIPKKFFLDLSKNNPELFTKIIFNVARDLARDLKFLRDYVGKQKNKS